MVKITIKHYSFDDIWPRETGTCPGDSVTFVRKIRTVSENGVIHMQYIDNTYTIINRYDMNGCIGG